MLKRGFFGKISFRPRLHTIKSFCGHLSAMLQQQTMSSIQIVPTP